MNKEEKSRLDELWNASGLTAPADKPAKKQEPAPEAPKEEPEAPQQEAPAAEPAPKEEPVKEEPKEEAPKEPKKKKEKKPKKEKVKKEAPPPAEIKKDIKFLVLYTTVFVIVISGLIGGSYMITSRIHKQMAENNQEINMNQSTLTNIQSENDPLKQQNTALTEAKNEAEELVNSVGDMVEQDANLVAAQSAYIRGDKELAAQLLSVLRRDELAEPNKAAYDLLLEKVS